MPDVELGRRVIQVIQEVDVSHLFTGHTLKMGSHFTIRTTNDKPGRTITYRVDQAKPEENPPLFAHFAAAEPGGTAIALRISGKNISDNVLPLTASGTLRNDTFQQASALSRARLNETARGQYVTASSLALGELLAS
ncbi:MAG: hypothetical protein ACREFU_19765 [Acetobacteraceae bacterium]